MTYSLYIPQDTCSIHVCYFFYTLLDGYPASLGFPPLPSPPSHPCLPPLCLPAAVQLNSHRVWGWRVEMSRPIVSRLSRRGSETMAGSPSSRCSFNDPLLHSAYLLPPRIRFWLNNKKSEIDTCTENDINTVEARTFQWVQTAIPRAF